MPFPLSYEDHFWPDGPRFLQALLKDTEAGGHTLDPERLPHEWLTGLVHDGALTRAEIRALAGALLQASTPGSVSCGARLAARLADRDLGDMLLDTLGGHEIGVLLAVDPLEAGRAVEDTVLDAAVGVVDKQDPAKRADLLARLRAASRPDRELPVLATWGSPEEIRRWLPGVLSEVQGTDAMRFVRALPARGEEFAEAVRHALAALDPDRRAEVEAALQA